MNNIRVTPETLEQQGEDLITLGGAIEDTLKAVEKKINEITDGWDGLAQDAYWDMYVSLKESLNQFPQLVNGLGATTKTAAEAYRDTDAKLKDAFNQNKAQ